MPTPPNTMSRRSLLGLFALALALRGLALSQVLADDFLKEPMADSRFFLQWAASLSQGSWWGEGIFVQSPLYAYFLALLMRITPDPESWARLLQMIWGAGGCVFVALCARRLTKTDWPALAAGGLAAIYAPFLVYDTLLLKESLGVFLVPLLLWLGLREKGLAAGLVLGMLGLVRSNAILLGLPIFWRLAAGSRRREAAKLCVGLALSSLPLTLRNWIVTGQLVLGIAAGGANFYLGNNPQATGLYYALPAVSAAPAQEWEDLRKAAEGMAGRPLTQAEASDFYVGLALRFIREQPGAWLRLMAKKFLIYWNAFEIPDNYDLGTFERRLPWLAWMPSFAWAATLGLLGLVLPRREAGLPRWESALYMGSVLLFHINDRYRLVGVPLLWIASAAALEGVASAARRRAWPALSAMLLAGAGACALTQTSVCDAEKPRVAAFAEVRWAEYLLGRRQWTEAHQALQRAYQLRRKDPFVHWELGELYRQVGWRRKALFHLQQSLRLGIHDPSIYAKIVQLHLSMGQRQKAIDFLLLARKVEPDQPQVPILLKSLGYSP